MEETATTLAREIHLTTNEQQTITIPNIQIIIQSKQQNTYIRNLTAKHIAKLVRLPGLIISATTLSAKATILHLACRSCRHILKVTVRPGFSGVQIPRVCARPRGETNQDKDCPVDPYMIVHEKSTFVDQQILKMQETPEAVPVGEMPRQIQLTVDR